MLWTTFNKLSARQQQMLQQALAAAGVAPPGLVSPPRSPVSVSDGTEITADDIAAFDALWMQPNDQANSLFAADWLLRNRIDAGVWGIGERMAVMARMYDLTHARRYLDHLREFIVIALKYRGDVYAGAASPDCYKCPAVPTDDFRGKNAPAWGGASVGSGGLNVAGEVVSSVYAYPIAVFARIVAEDPSLQTTYGSDAAHDANAVMQTMWAFMPQLEVRSVGHFFEAYLKQLDIYRDKPTNADCQEAYDEAKRAMDEENRQAQSEGKPPVNDSKAYQRLDREHTNCINMHIVAGAPIAYNENNAFSMMLIELWRALDSDFYRRSPDRASDAELTRTLLPVLVSRIHRHFVKGLQTRTDNPNGERYSWHHQDDQPAGISLHTEDISHAALDLRYLDVLRRNVDRLNAVVAPRGEPIPLDSLQVKRFANTFLEQIAAGTNFAHDVDGAPGAPDKDGVWEDDGLCDGWVQLAVADANVYRVCRETTLRVVNGAQPYLGIGTHSALLMTKRFSREVIHQDLTSASGAFPAAGDPFAYVFDAQGVQNVVFRATDGRVHELWRTATRIGHSDLSGLAGAPGVVGDPKGYVFGAVGMQNAVYRGADGHVHGLYWSTGAVGHDDLSALAHAPGPAGNPFGYVNTALGMQNVVYRGMDGHVHGLYWSTGAVGHDDLTNLSHAPAPAGDPFGYVVAALGMQNALYRGTDGHLHGLYWSTGAVGHDDLTSLSHAPPPAGNATAYVATTYSLQNAVYCGTDGHLHGLYWWTGAVGHDDLTNASGAALPVGNPAAYFVAADATHHVIYRSANGHLHELRWTTGAVSHTDLTALSGALPAAGDPSPYFVASDRTHHVIYRGGDSHVHELRWADPQTVFRFGTVPQAGLGQ